MGLAQDVSIAVKGMREDARDFVQAVNIELFRSIVLDTPVDKGRLQGNWQTTVDIPASGELDRTGKGGPLADITTTLRGIGLFWLTNNLPYAPVAEFGEWPHATEKTTPDGFSVQAPAGMVRKNAARIGQILRKNR